MQNIFVCEERTDAQAYTPKLSYYDAANHENAPRVDVYDAFSGLLAASRERGREPEMGNQRWISRPKTSKARYKGTPSSDRRRTLVV